jgi:phage terminase large subunit-like protein
MRGSRYVQVNNVFAPETILTHIRDSREGFKYIQVDATDSDGNPTWEAKYTKEYYFNLSCTLGVLSFNAEFNNRPYSVGKEFKDEMIIWGKIPPLKSFERLIAYWDVAYSESPTADYNAVRAWGLKDGKFYLIDCYVKQSKMSDAMRWMYAFRANTAKEGVSFTFYYESQFWNEALKIEARELAKEMALQKIPPLVLIKYNRSKTHKLDRIMCLLPYYQHGRIIWNELGKAKPSFQIGLAQLKGIEAGYTSNDDAPDADADSISILSKVSSRQKKTYKIGEKADRKY